jgi:flotillin
MIPAILIAVLLVAGLLVVITLAKNMYICSPSEVLIFSGRRFPLPGTEGRREVGFRVVRGGRAWRVPMIELVDRMMLTNMAIELSVTNAFSKGGVPLNVQAMANIKIPSEEPLLHNALERFLGKSRDEIIFVAKDTLEGNLRGVIAEMTPEEINQKKVIFQQKLVEEADKDMHRMGLALDNLQIQNISDDVGYLTSVGRVRGALVRKNAAIGEVKAKASAQVQKAQNQAAAGVAQIDSEIAVARKENERRIIESRTNREALVAEVRGQVAAQIRQAQAQLASWDAQIEKVRRQLEADVIAPAQARKQQAEQQAMGQAAQVRSQGRAAADALGSLAAQYRESGGRATEALLLQKLGPIFEQLASTMQAVKVERLTVLGGQQGTPQLGAALFAASEQVKAATGLDLLAAAGAVRVPEVKEGKPAKG